MFVYRLVELLIFILIGFGIYLILLLIVGMPDSGIKRKIRKAFHKDSSQTRLLAMAISLSPYIPMSKASERKFDVKIRSAGLELSPRVFLAKSLIQALLPIVFGAFLFVMMRNSFGFFLAVIFLFLGMALPLKSLEDLNMATKKKKEKIEWELPRFVGSIIQEFRHHRDIVRILENYKPSAGKFLRSELETTIADMKTGHLESALLRMDSRLGIASMSSIVRGLIAVMQGDDGLFYFQMLEHDLKQIEYQKLKRIVAKRPSKVMKYSLIILISFLLVYGTMFFLQISESFKLLKG